MKDSEPRSVRRYRAFVLLVLLATLSVAGSLRLAGDAADYTWDDDSLVPIDGHEHTVAVDEGELAMVWTFDFLAQSSCEVVDGEGVPVALEPVDGEFRRDAGKVGDWVGIFSFTPGSDNVVVTCDGVDSKAPSMIAVATASPISGPAEHVVRVGAAVVLALVALLATLLAVGFVIGRRPPTDGHAPA